MHTHTVFFWLWKTTSTEDRRKFEQGLDFLTRDENVLDRRIGKPARTSRDVIDNSYDYALVLRFKNTATHDAYQAGEPHQVFLDTCMNMWSRVQVYDLDETLAS